MLEQVTPGPTAPLANNIMEYSGSTDVTAAVTALAAPPADWRTEVVCEYDFSFQDSRIALATKPRDAWMRMVRDERWKYVLFENFRPMLFDLQNDPRDIPKLVARLLKEDLDLVAGWRQNRQDGLWLRKVPSKIANRIIRKITQLEFKDLGCSLKAYRASVLKRVSLYGEMHRFIPAWMATVTSPARMAEEPVSHHARAHGESKYGISRTLRVVLDLLSVNFFLRFASRPGHFFGGVGLGVSMIGGLILAYLAEIGRAHV